MIIKQRFRNNLEELIEQLKPRDIDNSLLYNIKELDEKHTCLSKTLNELNYQKSNLSKQRNDNNTQEGKKIKEQIANCTKELNEITAQLNDLIHLVPNIPNSELTETQKQIYSKNDDKIPKFSFKPKSHVELSENLSLINFDATSKISGSGFVIYLGKGDQLYRSLIAFTLDENEKKGYIRHYMPEIINKQSLFTTSQISKFADQLFKLENNNYLSPTGEVQLVNLYHNKIIEEEKLPVKLTTHTNCFRNEHISAGAENKGIIRLYQFSKTEIVTICKAEDSTKYLEQMCLDAEDLLNKLDLPYRRVMLANNDIGFSAHKTYDLEVWLPSENKYREISSVSNTLDFQSIRGKIRWKTQLLNKDEKTKYVHILNGSSLAIDRLFAAIVENYQDKDGNIEIPKKLHKYLNFTKITN